MKADVHDLRILRLAILYEEAYGAFIRRAADELVADPDLRRRLGRLAPPDDPHAGRLHALVARALARLGPEDALAQERGVLLDVVEVERAAREFYLRYVEELHDPNAVALFRGLAREEGGRLRAAEQVLEAHDARMRHAGLEPRIRRIHGAIDTLEVPLHEGVTDLDPARRRRVA